MRPCVLPRQLGKQVNQPAVAVHRQIAVPIRPPCVGVLRNGNGLCPLFVVRREPPVPILLCISKNGSKYIYGKNDLFSVVITFRYLLPKTNFLLFKKQLLHIFDRYEKQNSNLKLNDLFEYMGFPINWKEITKFRKI